jgi:hypothetical protein
MDFRPPTIESNDRRWVDAFAFVLVLLSVLFFPILWPLHLVRRHYGLRVRGFWIARKGRDAFEYQELRNGRVERLIIGGELMAIGQHVVYVPNEQEWETTMPLWSQGRRDEIIQNVQRGLGTKNYEYVFS